MKLDILIKNGHVIDTYTDIDGIKDIGIVDNKIIEITDSKIKCDNIINAKGCYVLPGLVDFHNHIYYGGSGWGINPEWLLATGTTSVVDPGTSGCANYEAFRRSIISNTKMHIKSFISVFSGGLLDINLHQDYNPELYNEKSIRILKSLYNDDILGLKIMLSKNIIGDDALNKLNKVIELAEKVGGLSVCVHTTDPGAKPEEIASLLRKRDIYCHCYQGKGDTIVNSTGKVFEGIRKARERGVLFDAANGGAHYCNEVAEACIKDGFLPDIISSDLTSTTFNKANKLRSLPFIMSRYLCLGVDIKNIVKATTETPAKLMKMEGRIGTLKAGANADVAIFKLKNQNVRFLDYKNEEYFGNKLLVPQMTISNGEIVYSQIDFNI